MKRKAPGPLSLSFLAASTIAAAAAVPSAQAAEFISQPHVFSIDDIQGAFNGSTYGAAGAVTDPTIVCDVPGGVACPPTAEVGPVIDKQGVPLYPIDSEFGFYVVDFLGAAQKIRDGNYLEGWAGNIEDAGEIDTPVLELLDESAGRDDVTDAGPLDPRAKRLPARRVVQVDHGLPAQQRHLLDCACGDRGELFGGIEDIQQCRRRQPVDAKEVSESASFVGLCDDTHVCERSRVCSSTKGSGPSSLT